MTEFLFKLGLSVVMVAVSGGALHWIWTHQIDPIASVAALLQGAVEPGWVATRDPNKLYQGGVAVADVPGSVDRSETKVVFRQLANTENLKRDQEFEYQRMRLIVRGVGTVIGQDIGMGPSGPQVRKAVLEDVECEIVG